MRNKITAIIILLITFAFIACGSDSSEDGGSGRIVDIFADVTTPGEAVTITAGAATYDMIYANNSVSITFPTGAGDTGTAAVTTNFFMSETEVTYELWKIVYDWATDAARTNKYTFSNTGTKGNDGAAEKSAQHPVTTINWRDAIVWCNALTEYYNDKKGANIACVYYTPSSIVIRDSRDENATVCDGAIASASAKGFRLPTSMEWEYSARFTGTDETNVVTGVLSGTDFDSTTGKWTKGNSASGATKSFNDTTGTSPYFAGKLANDKVAVYKYYWDGTGWIDNSTSSTAEVMSKGIAGANSFGLYDMSGNVVEWCFDFRGTGSGGRVVRGGSFGSQAQSLQIGFETNIVSHFEYGDIGFRFARTK